MKKNYHHLKVLSTSKPHQAKALLKVADDDVIKSVCECVYNVLKSNVPVTSRQKKQLAKYKTPLLKLVNKQTPLSKKRSLLVQKGGNFLPLLLEMIANVSFSLR